MTADPSQAPKLLDQVRGKIRLKHYSIRTEQAYVEWIKRFILHFGKRHPRELGAADVEAFLTHLAVAGNVAASTQNQAKSALLFLYREVLETELPWLDNVERARAPKRLPVVLTRDEVHAVLSRLSGTHWLIASLLYGAGLRIMEALRLRVKDMEFSRKEILVRDGKGFKDRVTMLPAALAAPLADHLKRVNALHGQDLAAGAGRCTCPMRWSASIRARRATGLAVRVSLGESFGRILAAASSGATTCRTRRCSAPCAMRCATPASTSRPRRTRCATPSPRTCWKAATTSAPCRSCSATRMFPRR